MTDSFESAETAVLAVLVVGYALTFALRRLRRAREGFQVGTPVAVGVAVRLAAIAAIGASGRSSTLRGGDEVTFLSYARDIARQPWGTGNIPHGLYGLHTELFAAQIKIGGFSAGALRVTQVGIAMLGIVLILAAVHDLVGGRAARLTGWVLAFEPASVFFNSALHKEPLMLLASGLVVFGGTRSWRRIDPFGVLVCAFGGLIAVETRSYAGWFLVSASVLLLVHAALRQLSTPLRAMPVLLAVIIAGFIATPVLLQLSSSKSLQALQGSQNANTDPSNGAFSSGPNGNNLALERVDFSSRSGILSNLPQRISDLLLRPYPWQLADSSQQFGAIGTLVAYAVLLMLVLAMLTGSAIFARAAPLLYPAIFLMIAYSLSAGNAGTGFRYRTHLVTLGIAAVVTLRGRSLHASALTLAGTASGRSEDQRAPRPSVAASA